MNSFMKTDIPDFIEFLRERLILMDEVFGIDNFKNDITRIKCNPKNFYRKAYGNIKDLILFYSKTKDVIWDDPKLPFSQDDKEKLFNKIDKI